MLKRLAFVAFSVLLAGSVLRAEDYGTAPANIQSALIVKILAFHNGISAGGDIRIHVIGAPEFAAELKNAVGMAIGSAKLAAVTESGDLPASAPSAVYVSDPGKVAKVLAYTKSNKVLSMTGAPALVAAGICLGVGVGEGKPKVLLNLTTSREEGIDWNPAILKVAATFGK